MREKHEKVFSVNFKIAGHFTGYKLFLKYYFFLWPFLLFTKNHMIEKGACIDMMNGGWNCVRLASFHPLWKVLLRGFVHYSSTTTTTLWSMSRWRFSVLTSRPTSWRSALTRRASKSGCKESQTFFSRARPARESWLLYRLVVTWQWWITTTTILAGNGEFISTTIFEKKSNLQHWPVLCKYTHKQTVTSWHHFQLIEHSDQWRHDKGMQRT
jgi:hypothetical protein